MRESRQLTMAPAMPVPARILHLGSREFGEVWRLQGDLVAARQRREIEDTLVLVEHPDVITMGRGSHPENLRGEAGIPVFEIERGGDVTYHGPGQLVGYPIFLLRDDERDLHRYLRNLEEVLILTLADLGIAATRVPGKTGVWTADGERKLGSLGIAVKRWVTMHGFALNVATDLSRFSAINPCGFDASVMASVQSVLERPVAVTDVVRLLVPRVAQVFAREFGDG